jgi:branched-subunit amino acid aminotransferase/4-amino-4-deoxychorismate lyase
MPQSIAFLNGKYVAANEAVVSVNDTGFLMGTTVAEQLRTFGGKLFRLEEHLQRLENSLAVVQVALDYDVVKLADHARHVAEQNHKLLADGDDLALAMFVTPGISAAMAPDGRAGGPTVCMHTRPLPFVTWADKYQTGELLATTDVLQVPNQCWPAELKCRSRMHYYLADKQASERHPGSRAVMLDDVGYVTEATTANILIYRESDGLLVPPAHKILPGISLATLSELANQLAIPVSEADLTPHDLASANEVLLCSTSPCVLPVTQFNGQPIASGTPGPVFAKLLAAWSNRVGLDIAAQAKKFTHRP